MKYTVSSIEELFDADELENLESLSDKELQGIIDMSTDRLLASNAIVELTSRGAKVDQVEAELKHHWSSKYGLSFRTAYTDGAEEALRSQVPIKVQRDILLEIAKESAKVVATDPWYEQYCGNALVDQFSDAGKTFERLLEHYPELA